jgi:hypothetical protein
VIDRDESRRRRAGDARQVDQLAEGRLGRPARQAQVIRDEDRRHKSSETHARPSAHDGALEVDRGALGPVRPGK